MVRAWNGTEQQNRAEYAFFLLSFFIYFCNISSISVLFPPFPSFCHYQYARAEWGFFLLSFFFTSLRLYLFLPFFFNSVLFHPFCLFVISPFLSFSPYLSFSLSV